MAVYVADTHALVWYLAGSPLLGEAARRAFDEAVSGESRVIVAVISLAELVMMVEKGRSEVEIAAVMATLRAAPGFEIRPLTPEVALSIQSLIALRDIHDRLIVAEAIANNATLVTRDQSITSSGLVPIIW
ncbi:MAG: type II toxin-antitoxin system VapC family toxin [Chloroflexi bacterium]|nr:type II toxin-antitoxin system VapC family toxin [Chloroflexota bacterium]MBI3760284.1 type II toxin-antitoxin system VapC family toxin [Chloroflexota bacterium]